VIIDQVSKIEDPRIDKKDVIVSLIDEIDPDSELDEVINYVIQYIHTKYSTKPDVSEAIGEYYTSLLMERDMLIDYIDKLKEEWEEMGISEEERDKLLKEAEADLEKVKKQIEEFEKKQELATKKKPRKIEKKKEVKKEVVKTIPLIKYLEEKREPVIQEKREPVIREKPEPVIQEEREPVMTRREIYEKVISLIVEELSAEYSLRPKFIREMIELLEIKIPEKIEREKFDELLYSLIDKARHEMVRLVAIKSKMIAPLPLIRGRYGILPDNVRKPRGMYDEIKDWSRVKEIFLNSVDRMDYIPIDKNIVIVYPYTFQSSYDIICIVSHDDVIEACSHEVIVFKEEYVYDGWRAVGYIVPESKLVKEVIEFFKRQAYGKE
jgi:hypothetical protein